MEKTNAGPDSPNRVYSYISSNVGAGKIFEMVEYAEALRFNAGKPLHGIIVFSRRRFDLSP